MADRRAHCTIFSTVVVRTGISSSAMVFGPGAQSFRRLHPAASTRAGTAPVEGAFAPHIDVAGHEQREERENLPEPCRTQIAKRDGPGIEECDLDVEEEKDHRHEVELDRLPFTRVADG